MSLLLSQVRWPSLAQDLAIMTVPGSPITDLSKIYIAYNLTDAELKEILKIPAFLAMLKEAVETFKTQGTKAGAIYRASTFAQALIEDMFTKATTGKMESKDSLKLLELLLKTSGLMDGKDSAVNVQTNVAVSLPLPPGMKNRKFGHALPRREAIDATT